MLLSAVVTAGGFRQERDRKSDSVESQPPDSEIDCYSGAWLEQVKYFCSTHSIHLEKTKKTTTDTQEGRRNSLISSWGSSSLNFP